MAQPPPIHRAANLEVTGSGVVRFQASCWSHQRKAVLPSKSALTQRLVEGCLRPALRPSLRRSSVVCFSMPLQSDELQPKVWYFAVANAESLMLDGAALDTVLQDGMERASREGRDRDVWLIMEPAFLSDHPGLKSLDRNLRRPTAAILSPNSEWMLSYVKQQLPQAVIGKFLAPSVSVPDPLKSNIHQAGQVIGGGGVWH